MEFCVGKTFVAMLSDAAPVSALLRGIHDLAPRLREIHQAGYVHSDLKLDNVILEEGDDGSVRARVIDLGLCTRLGESPGFQGLPESHPHGAPELLRDGVASVESEVFSPGMILKGVLQVHASSFAELFCPPRGASTSSPTTSTPTPGVRSRRLRAKRPTRKGSPAVNAREERFVAIGIYKNENK